MLAGTVYFYGDRNDVLFKMDIEDYDDLSQKAFFDKILELGASKVVVKGVSNNQQSNESETILYSKNY